MAAKSKARGLAGPRIPYETKLVSARRSVHAYLVFRKERPTAEFIAKRWGISVADARLIIADELTKLGGALRPRPRSKSILGQTRAVIGAARKVFRAHQKMKAAELGITGVSIGPLQFGIP